MHYFQRSSVPFFIGGGFGLGFAVFYPFISPYLASLGFTNSQISFINAFGPLLLILIAPILGRISDEIGRKKIIIAAVLIEIISVAALLFSLKSIVFVGLLIALQFSSAVILELMVMSAIEDNLKNGKRGLFTGIYQSIRSVGVVAGPLAGAFVVALYPINLTFKLAVLIFLIILLLTLFLKENRGANEKPKAADFNFIAEIKQFLANKNLRGMAILGFFANFTHRGTTVFLPLFVIQELKAPLKFVGIIAALGMFFSLFQFVHGWICDKKGSRKVIISGMVLSGLALLLVYFADSILALGLVVLLFSLGLSMWNTSAWCFMSNIGEKIKKEGQVVGSYEAISDAGIFASFITSGFVISFIGLRGIFVLYGVLILISVALSFRYLFFNTNLQRLR